MKHFENKLELDFNRKAIWIGKSHMHNIQIGNVSNAMANWKDATTNLGHLPRESDYKHLIL